MPPRRACDQTSLPEWLEGRHVATAGSTGAGFCFVDDFRFNFSCGRFRFTANGGDYSACIDGDVESTADPATFKLVADDKFMFLFNTQSAAMVSALSSPYHGLSQIEMRSVSGDERVALARMPTATPLAPAADLVGTWTGETMTIDYFDDRSGAPGARVVAGAPVAVDGTGQNGKYAASFEAGSGEFRIGVTYGWHSSLDHVWVLTAWDGAQGEVAFQNGPGICSDQDSRAVIRRGADGKLEVETTAQIRDARDVDGDGNRAEWLFKTVRIVLKR